MLRQAGLRLILASGKGFKIINLAMCLLCFPVTPTPIIPKVWDERQSGTSVVHIRATNRRRAWVWIS